MKRPGKSLFFLRIYLNLIFSLVCLAPVVAQSPLSLGNEYTVEDDGTPEEYSSVTLTSKDSHLIVKGTLIIYGDLDMSNANDARATFEDGSIVIVYGNVKSGNKVFISTTSHFIIYGNFERGTGSGHGDTDFTNGSVYIFGEVDDSWEIDDCDAGNDGDSSDNGSCEYRNEEDFLEDDLPPELQEALNCFKIPPVKDVIACVNQTAVFEVQDFADAEVGVVSYQWQRKSEAGIWENISGETNLSLMVENVQFSLNNTKYRLTVSSSEKCKLGISNVATLTVINPVDIGEIAGPSAVCGKAPITYSLPETAASVEYVWEVPGDWTLQGGSSTRQITVIPGIISGEIKVQVTAPCGIHERTLWVQAGIPGKWNGSVNSLWEESGNWECGIIPDASTDVLIPSGAVTYPVINKGITGSSHDISIEADAKLTVSGILEVSGSILAFENLNVTVGSLYFMGALAQKVPLDVITDGRIENLRIANPAGVSIEGAIEISGVLTAFEGDLVTNGNLTLVSDANRTALISGAGTGNILGMLTLQRYLNPAYGYKYFSSPFQGTTVADFVPYMDLKDPTTNFPHFYSYQEDRKDSSGNDLTGWEAYTDPSNPLNSLEGYALNFGIAGGAVTIALSGEVNNGPQTRTLSNHNGTYTGGYHLVGNPYPSPIDWDNAAAWTKDNIDDAVYFFSASATDPYTGTYSSYVENGPSTDGKTTSIIASMQGFFVHVSEGSTQGTLGITNAARVDDFSQEFHKSSQRNTISLIRISAGFEGEEIMDPTVIYFDYKASASFDSQFDAYKLMNTHPDVPSFYSLTTEKEELSINAIGSPQSQELVRIPMGYRALRSGNLSLKLQDLDLPSGLHIYLVDLEKESYFDLSREKAYTTPIGKGSSNSRFEIVLSEKTITDPAKLLKTPMSVYGSKEKLTVTLNLEREGPSEITVSTLSGQVLESITTSARKVEIEGIRSAGVYIVSLKSGETQYTKKILIK